MKRTTHRRLAVAEFILAGACLVAWPASMFGGALCRLGDVAIGAQVGCITVHWHTVQGRRFAAYYEPRLRTVWLAALQNGALGAALWIPALLFAIPAFFHWRAGRRPLPGHCPCGYDLTGNVSGRCPECGREVKM